MLKKSVERYSYEVAVDGSRIDILNVSDFEKKDLTVTELRDFLNKLIEEGYGDYEVEASTQDGSTYSVRNEVLVYNKAKVVEIN